MQTQKYLTRVRFDQHEPDLLQNLISNSQYTVVKENKLDPQIRYLIDFSARVGCTKVSKLLYVEYIYMLNNVIVK